MFAQKLVIQACTVQCCTLRTVSSECKKSTFQRSGRSESGVSECVIAWRLNECQVKGQNARFPRANPRNVFDKKRDRFFDVGTIKSYSQERSVRRNSRISHREGAQTSLQFMRHNFGDYPHHTAPHRILQQYILPQYTSQCATW